MKNLKKSLAVLLAVLMLTSLMPMFASAAAVTLNRGSCELVEAPKLSYNGGEPTSDLTVPYGTTWGDITVVGGSIKYNDEVMDGKFDWWESSKTTIPNTGVQSSVMIYFYPTDTTKYKEGGWASLESSPLEGWPNLTVDGTDAILAEAPTTLGGGLGATLSKVKLNGGKVVDEHGTEITTGKWAWVKTSTKLTTEGTFEYEAKWTCKGYDSIFINIPVNVQQYKTVLAEAPTAATLASGKRLRYATLSGGIVKLEDGTDVTSVGTWKYVNQNTIPTENGEHEVQWTATGYDTITVNVYVELEQFKTKILTAPTMTAVDMGAYTWQSTTTAGVVVLDDGTATDVTSKGTWKYVFPEGVTRLYQDTVVTATWSATGYETIEVPVTVKVNQNLDYNVVTPPSLKEDTVLYAEGLMWEDLELIKGVFTDKTTGAEIPGTYKYANVENLKHASSLNYFTGQVNASTFSVFIHFIPDDENLASFGFLDTITIQQLEFTLADTFEIVLNEGVYFDGKLVKKDSELQFSKLDTIPAGIEIESVSWSSSKFNPQTAAKGSTTMVTVTITPVNRAYKTVTAEIPVTIQEDFVIGGRFVWNNGSNSGQTGATNKNLPIEEKNAGIINVSIDWQQIRAKGTVTISAVVDGEEYVITTVSPDETGLFKTSEKWQTPKDGTYTIKWTYNPSEEDTCVILNPVATTSEPIEIDIRRQYSYTIIVGDKVTEGIAYDSTYVSWYWGSFSSGSADELDHWEFKDANGNVFTPVDLAGNPVDLTKADNGFTMPEHDVVVTAKGAVENGGILGGDIIGGDTGDGIFGNIWSFLQKIIEWFRNIFNQLMGFFADKS